MTVTDAKGIVTGPEDSATQYFKRTTTRPLTDAFRPIVDSALADVGAVQTYDAAVQGMGSTALGGPGRLLGGASGGADGFRLPDFVLVHATAATFHYIWNPAQRSRPTPPP